MDCAANPVLAELYGGAGGAYCLHHHQSHGVGDGGLALVSGLGGALEQVLTIGFLVSAYFLFKRSRGGIVDWDETQLAEDDEDDEWEAGEEDEDFLRDDVFTAASADARGRNPAKRGAGRRSSSRSSGGARTCPQCGGSGRFAWTGPATAACEMCSGAGTIDLTAGLRGAPRARGSLPPALPPGDSAW